MTTQLEIPEKALQIKEIPAFTGLCFTTRATLPTLSRHTSDVVTRLYAEANHLGLEVIGPVQWIYTGVNGDETNEFHLDIALPIRQPGSQPDTFSYQVFPSFRCAFYTYRGPWSEFGQVYDALFRQLYRDGNQNDGYVREVYTIIDLENPSRCVTEIQLKLA
ncbi:GyrI-like domain-containing protein [Spirosoma radiotolerans]|uniref:Transcription activator effector-binding protein n=1 Tax=Spirosoma radiotolerans TaxID=1379870 RepID=A0A0E3VAJ3_9BACT|nr:GyrI-like domain-containing protein [Spirosoma radiotolerans]AKD58176.1 transcription activator effector-binding protein [Spirosoma radiotolerans]